MELEIRVNLVCGICVNAEVNKEHIAPTIHWHLGSQLTESLWGQFQPHPTWTWPLPGMGQAQIFWEKHSSVSAPSHREETDTEPLQLPKLGSWLPKTLRRAGDYPGSAGNLSEARTNQGGFPSRAEARGFSSSRGGSDGPTRWSWNSAPSGAGQD